MNNMTTINSDHSRKSHLCLIKKDQNFNGYGFNLHAEKGKSGHYIGCVDSGSPAELAGLREGDLIIEVNGNNVELETHKQVVNRIRLNSNETKILVIHSSYFNENHPDNHIDSDPISPDFNLQITAAEFRAKLAEKKKYDPKKEPINFRKKFEIAEKL